jgi:GNAT superfamily N-acetyltransferase
MLYGVWESRTGAFVTMTTRKRDLRALCDGLAEDRGVDVYARRLRYRKASGKILVQTSRFEPPATRDDREPTPCDENRLLIEGLEDLAAAIERDDARSLCARAASALRYFYGLEPDAANAYVWESQVIQYPVRGPRGIAYYAGKVNEHERPVDCLLFRDKNGKLRGILNYYAVDYPPYEVAGNVNVWVEPRWQKRGVGVKLLAEADRRWKIDLQRQRYTEAGVRLVTAYLAKRAAVS